MYPVHTRPIRSVSPPPRRPAESDAAKPAVDSKAKQNLGQVEQTPETEPAISIRAAIREYEATHDQLSSANSRARELRSKLSLLRTNIESFMQERDLERLGTRDGRLVVRTATHTSAPRPGKRETVRCVEETVGRSDPDLAKELVQKLFDDKRTTKTVTRFDRRS